MFTRNLLYTLFTLSCKNFLKTNDKHVLSGKRSKFLVCGKRKVFSQSLFLSQSTISVKFTLHNKNKCSQCDSVMCLVITYMEDYSRQTGGTEMTTLLFVGMRCMGKFEADCGKVLITGQTLNTYD